jgi:hypothetical protein
MKMVYINPISRQRERAGVRVDIMFTVSPSPVSSPPWGEEMNLISE